MNKINHLLSEAVLGLQYLLCSKILSLLCCNKLVAFHILSFLTRGLLVCLIRNPKIINVRWEHAADQWAFEAFSHTCVVEGGINESTVPEVCIQWSNVFKHTVLKEWIFKGYWFKLHHNKPAQYKEFLSIYLHNLEIATDQADAAI